MLYGTNVVLRTVRESDFATLFQYLNDVRNRGEFEQISLTSEVQMRKEFAETGFWQPDEGILHITDRQDNLLGYVSYSKPFRSPPGMPTKSLTQSTSPPTGERAL